LTKIEDSYLKMIEIFSAYILEFIHQSKDLDKIIRKLFRFKTPKKPIKISLFFSRNYVNNTDEIFSFIIQPDVKLKKKIFLGKFK
jgi:hypothetical protein